MIPALVAALVAAAPPPRASAGASVVVHVPRPDGLVGLTAVMARAGQRAPILHPSTWGPELFPLVALDPARPATFTDAGLDPAQPLTISVLGASRLSCAALSDPARFQAAAKPRLDAIGDPWKGKGGLVGAQIEGAPVGGYALKRRAVCAAEDPDESGRLLREGAKLAGSAPAPLAGLGEAPGALQLVRPGAFALGLDGAGDQLTAAGVTLRAGRPALRNAGSSRYGALPRSGLAVLKARLAPESLEWLLLRGEARISAACPDCDRRAVIELFAALAGTLSGDVAWRIDRVKVTGSLRQPSARFFALKQAVVLHVGEVERARQLLAGAGKWSNARTTERGLALRLEGGELELGLQGAHLFAGNDADAVSALLAELPAAPAAQAHGIELSVDPKKLSKAYAQVSLLDLMTAPELASIVAVGTELGPLLGASTEVALWLDSAAGGRHRFGGRWLLDPASAP